MTTDIEILIEELIGQPDYAAVLAMSPWPDGGWMAGIINIDDEYAKRQKLLIAKLADVGEEDVVWDYVDGWVLVDPAGTTRASWLPRNGRSRVSEDWAVMARAGTLLEALRKLKEKLELL